MSRRVVALLSAVLMVVLAVLGGGVAAAVEDPDGGGGVPNPDGTILRSFDAEAPECSIGTGIAFTGQNLVLSCWYTNELYVIDPDDGHLVSTLTVTGANPGDTGLGALAYDRRNDALYACTWPSEQVVTIRPSFFWEASSGEAVVTDTLFTAPNGCIDGLAYDGTDNTFFASGDVQTTIYHVKANGDVVDTRDVSGKLNGCGNSGLAVGGDDLYMANNGCSQIYRVEKGMLNEDPSLFASYPERLEDLECDDITFGADGATVIWSKDAYDLFINAFEIGAKECGYGGYPHGALLSSSPEDREPVGGFAQFLITAPEVPDDEYYEAPLEVEVLAGPHKGTPINPSCSLSCTIYPGGHVSLGYSSIVDWPAPEPQGEGIDQLRVFADLNENGVFDSDEPFAFQKVWWLRHTDYVALGDSYSAGEGLSPYVSGTDVDFDPGYNQCHRSTAQASAYFVSSNDGLDTAWIAEAAHDSTYGTTFAFNACSGATTEDVLTRTRFTEPGPQIQQTPLGENTDLVTLSIGGNDVGFGPVLIHCATTENCDQGTLENKPMAQLVDERVEAVKDKLVNVLNQLKATTTKNGNPATVVLMGYPHLFPDEVAEQTCTKLSGVDVPFNGHIGFETGEQNLMNTAADKLTVKMAQAAREAGALYVPVLDAFRGHAPCEADTAYTESITLGDINDIRSKGLKDGIVGTGAFHPTPAGASTYAGLVTETLYNTGAYGYDPTGLPNNPPAQPAFARAAASSLAADDPSLGMLNDAYVYGSGSCANVPNVTQSGKPVRVEAEGFAPGAAATIKVLQQGAAESTATQVGTATANSKGHVTATVTVPASSPLGTFPELRVTGTDSSGHAGMALGTVFVVDRCAAEPTSWPFTGWLDPVENTPTVNVVKAGSAVPMKFKLGADRGLNIFASAPTARPVACDTGADLNAVTDTVTAGGSSLQYDAATGTYTYVWKTQKAWAGTCQRFTMALTDGTSHTALFRMK